MIDSGCNLICSVCEQVVKTISDEEEVVLSVDSNFELIHTLTNNQEFNQIAQRLAKDPTCELTGVKCKCGGLCRLVYNTAKQPCYVCSECRGINERKGKA